MSILHGRLAAGVPPAVALHEAQAVVRSRSRAELAARYMELGGEGAHGVPTRRRGTTTAELAPKLDLGDEFTDNVNDDSRSTNSAASFRAHGLRSSSSAFRSVLEIDLLRFV